MNLLPTCTCVLFWLPIIVDIHQATATTSEVKEGLLRYDSTFDYFVFSQEWPPSVCMAAKQFGSNDCKVPKNVTTWTIHGLWPTRRGKSHGPFFCGQKTVFDLNAINSIRGDLMTYWNNLFTDTATDDLWFHEWCKHGTCAEFSSELKYFQNALKLNTRFDILKRLNSHDIVPTLNKRTYQYIDILKALKSLGSGINIQCHYDKETKTQYLIQIEVCLSKTLEVLDCHHPKGYQEHSLRKRSLSFISSGNSQPEIVVPGWSKKRCYRKHAPSTGDIPICRDTEPIFYPPIEN